MRERQPHHKTAQAHRPDCGCAACRVWRRRHRAARVLDNLSEVERRAGVRTTREHYTETPEALAHRIERSKEIRARIVTVVDQILDDNGWPESVRRKAEDEFATEVVRIMERDGKQLEKWWAGDTFAQRRRGAISSLQVLLGNHKPFRNQRGRLQDAKGNVDWVLDIWEVGLAEWEGQRQLRLV